jgi:hypothetical protein
MSSGKLPHIGSPPKGGDDNATTASATQSIWTMGTDNSLQSQPRTHLIEKVTGWRSKWLYDNSPDCWYMADGAAPKGPGGGDFCTNRDYDESDAKRRADNPEGIRREEEKSVLRCAALHYVPPRCAALCCVALHCTAQHCTALHCAALHCTALHFTALHCIVLHCAAMRCAAMCCDALRCAAMRCDAMCCDALRCDTMCCDALRCAAMRCDALLCACDALRCAAMRCDALRCAAMCDAIRCDALPVG